MSPDRRNSRLLRKSVTVEGLSGDDGYGLTRTGGHGTVDLLSQVISRNCSTAVARSSGPTSKTSASALSTHSACPSHS